MLCVGQRCTIGWVYDVHSSLHAAHMSHTHPPRTPHTPHTHALDRKRYWRLSLLIHPDKCTHPKANDAFQAVGHAAKQLQVHDAGLICFFMYCVHLFSCAHTFRVLPYAYHPSLFFPPFLFYSPLCHDVHPSLYFTPNFTLHQTSLYTQDEALRSAADKRLEDQRIEKATQEMLQQQERARQWRVARGQATAEDLRGPVGPAARDTWMTDLPIARSGGGQPSQTSVRSFSIKGVRERGDTSGWTSVAGKQGPLQLQAAVCFFFFLLCVC